MIRTLALTVLGCFLAALLAGCSRPEQRPADTINAPAGAGAGTMRRPAANPTLQ
jgi:hypothetical protein